MNRQKLARTIMRLSLTEEKPKKPRLKDKPVLTLPKRKTKMNQK